MSQAILIGYKEIQSKIIEVLKNYTVGLEKPLEHPSKIRAYHYEIPPEGFKAGPHPLICIEEIGGPISRQDVSEQDEHTIRFHIIVVDKGKNPEVVKKSIQDISEHIQNALKQNRSLDGPCQPQQVCESRS